LEVQTATGLFPFAPDNFFLSRVNRI